MGAQFSAIDEAPSGVITQAVQPGVASHAIAWAVFGVFCAASILFGILVWQKPMWQRMNGYIAVWVCVVSAVTYFVQACHGGSTLVPLYWQSGSARTVFYSRYVAWCCTTPFLLLNPLLVAGVPVGTYLWIAVADLLMLITGLCGALTASRLRWAYYALGSFFFIFVLLGMLAQGPKYAHMRGGKKLATAYTLVVYYLMTVFTCYPVVWALCEGSNILAATAETACYAALDIAAKVVFSCFMMFNVAKHELAALGEERKWGVNDISLFEAPITAPLSGVRQRFPFVAKSAQPTTTTTPPQVVPQHPVPVYPPDVEGAVAPAS